MKWEVPVGKWLLEPGNSIKGACGASGEVFMLETSLNMHLKINMLATTKHLP